MPRRNFEVVIIPGAFTPTEIYTALFVGRRHRENLSGGKVRAGIFESGARSAAANPNHADERR